MNAEIRCVCTRCACEIHDWFYECIADGDMKKHKCIGCRLSTRLLGSILVFSNRTMCCMWTDWWRKRADVGSSPAESLFCALGRAGVTAFYSGTE